MAGHFACCTRTVAAATFAFASLARSRSGAVVSFLPGVAAAAAIMGAGFLGEHYLWGEVNGMVSIPLLWAGAAMILRCPMIPDINTDDAHLTALAELARSLSGLVEVNLLPYHRLGLSKTDRLGYQQPRGERSVSTRQSPADDQVDAWLSRLTELGVANARRS